MKRSKIRIVSVKEGGNRVGPLRISGLILCFKCVNYNKGYCKLKNNY
jgi:hypothetical protein